MRRLIALATVAGITLLGLVGVTGPTQAKVPGPNGQIVFTSHQGAKPIPGDCGRDARATFTVNPDGTHVHKLVPGEGCVPLPRWSPDGMRSRYRWSRAQAGRPAR